MPAALGGLALVVLAILGLLAWAARSRSLHRWLPGYVRRAARGRPPCDPATPIDLFVCIADHFEPAFGGVGLEQERRRVETWVDRYPIIASRHADAEGRPPQHSFFFPVEEYRAEHLDRLALFRGMGLGDIEIHLHHQGDGSEGLRATLLRAKRLLHEQHGLLHVDPATGEVRYAFIHGNWALDNSGPRGAWCGVNDELTVLRETGCYADFTFPSAPHSSQPRTVNSIYYATDDRARPRSHDTGEEVEAGRPARGDLLIIQGPLALDWGSRKLMVLPRIENAEIAANNPPGARRAALWVRQHVHVAGCPNWVFVKLHTHGAEERNFDALLGRPMDELLSHLEHAYNDGRWYRLHYVTAREIYLVIKAAEAGLRGDPAPILEEARA